MIELIMYILAFIGLVYLGMIIGIVWRMNHDPEYKKKMEREMKIMRSALMLRSKEKEEEDGW